MTAKNTPLCDGSHDFDGLPGKRQANCELLRTVNDADKIATDETISAILTDWRRRLRAAPDLKAREGARGQRERSLTRALLAAAEAREGSAQATESLGKLAMIAASYGADQPRERLDPGALCEELGHLRQAVWHHLRGRHLDRETATRRILAFDRALTLALRAALLGGYHCTEADAELLKVALPEVGTDHVGRPRPTR
jgi:hypothetical protein